MRVTIRGVDRSASYQQSELEAMEVVLAADQGEVGLGHGPVIDDAGSQVPYAGEQFKLDVGGTIIIDGLAGGIIRDRNGIGAGTRLVNHHTIADDNAFLNGHRAIKWKRPAETDRARMLAFIDDFLGHLSLDTTWVLNTHNETLPKKTYTSETLYSELQEDCGKPTGKTLFIEQRRIHWHLPTEGYVSDIAIVLAEDADYIDTFPLDASKPPSRTKDPATLGNDVVAINAAGAQRSATDATSITRHDDAGARHQILVEEGEASTTELQTIATTTKNERRNERITYEGTIGPMTAAQVERIPVGCLINVTDAVWGLTSSTQRIATMTIRYMHPDLFMVDLELGYPIFRRSKPPITTPPSGLGPGGAVLPPYLVADCEAAEISHDLFDRTVANPGTATGWQGFGDTNTTGLTWRAGGEPKNPGHTVDGDDAVMAFTGVAGFPFTGTGLQSSWLALAASSSNANIYRAAVSTGAVFHWKTTNLRVTDAPSSNVSSGMPSGWIWLIGSDGNTLTGSPAGTCYYYLQIGSEGGYQLYSVPISGNWTLKTLIASGPFANGGDIEVEVTASGAIVTINGTDIGLSPPLYEGRIEFTLWGPTAGFPSTSRQQALYRLDETICPEDPETGQPITEPTVTGDGTTTSFTTAFPYVAGSLRVIVNGLDWTNLPGVVVETDPATGAFDLIYPVPLGASFLIRYVAA